MNQGSEDIPDVTEEEINYAIKKVKNNRSPGKDRVVEEAIKTGGPILLNKIKTPLNTKWPMTNRLYLYRVEET